MRVHPFAILAAATGPGAVEITHLPILVDRDGEVVTLRGHVARANPMARLIADSTPQAPLHATAVFAGPQAYVSPDWYETENQVPTWNYLAVHASGALEHVADPVAFEALRSEEHTSELQSLMRISYAVFCLKKKKKYHISNYTYDP